MTLPKAVFFPYTDAGQTRLDAINNAFAPIILYQMPLGQPEDHLTAAVSGGRVELRPVSFIENEAEVAGILEQFRSAAEVFRQPGGLSLLKRLAQEKDPENSAAQLVSHIRRGGASSGEERVAEREAQVFLHFAQELDRQEAELDDILLKAEKREQLTGRFLGVETEDNDSDLPDGGPSLVAGGSGGTAMLPRRLEAWARFYLEFGPHDAPLVTDQPEAIAAMDTNLARIRGSKGLPEGETEALALLADFHVSGPVDTACPDWTGFVGRVATQAWSSNQLAGLVEEATKLFPASETGLFRIRAYILPGSDLAAALAAAAGLDAEAGRADTWAGPVVLVTRT